MFITEVNTSDFDDSRIFSKSKLLSKSDIIAQLRHKLPENDVFLSVSDAFCPIPPFFPTKKKRADKQNFFCITRQHRSDAPIIQLGLAH